MRRFLHPLLIATLMILSVMPRVEAAPPEAPDSALAAVFFRYYGALQKERYEEALGLLHERLRQALQVRTAKDLAARSIVASATSSTPSGGSTNLTWPRPRWT